MISIRIRIIYLVFIIIHKMVVSANILNMKAIHRLEFHVSKYDTEVASPLLRFMYISYLVRNTYKIEFNMSIYVFSVNQNNVYGTHTYQFLATGIEK